MIELDRIERDFLVGDEVVHALNEVSLSLPAGDYVSVMGPSGSGKSTLLNVLGCLDRVTLLAPFLHPFPDLVLDLPCPTGATDGGAPLGAVRPVGTRSARV